MAIFSRADKPKVKGKSFISESKTVQSEASKTDIHDILRRAQVTGVIGDPYQMAHSQLEPLFVDFSDEPTLHKAMEIQARANEFWYTIPAKERAKYSNDPRLYLEAMYKEHASRAMAALRAQEEEKKKASSSAGGTPADSPDKK